MSPEWESFTVNVCSNLSRHLDHMLVVGVPVAQGALGQDGDVGEDVEESQARSYVRGSSEVVGAGIFAEEVTGTLADSSNLLKTTMNVNRRPTAM